VFASRDKYFDANPNKVYFLSLSKFSIILGNLFKIL